MSALLDQYTALSGKSSRDDVFKVLKAIEDASPVDVRDGERIRLVNALLEDLSKLKKGKDSIKLTGADAAQALGALKSLGKHPSGARILAQKDNLTLLLGLSEYFFKENMDASLEALRCVANSMLLVEEARRTLIGDDIKGGDIALRLLERSNSPDTIFLASRILFLATASSAYGGPLLIQFVDEKGALDIIAPRLEGLIVSILAGTKMAREAMTDLLKFTYNILAHYPKIADCEMVQDFGCGDEQRWSAKLDAILPAALRAFNALPPTPNTPLAAPLTHVIHALIEIPVTPKNRATWFPSTTPERRSGSSSSRPSPTQTPTDLASGTAPSSPKEGKPGALDRALSMLHAGRRSFSSRPSSPLPPPTTPTDTAMHAADLLESALTHYLPGAVEPDDPSVRARIQKEARATLDEHLCPLVVLLAKLAQADVTYRAKLKEWVVPANLDRSMPLAEREDTLGRLLRCLPSVYHPRLKACVGEFLYACCNQDAMQLVTAVGYGSVAGFLFNKGIVTAPTSGVQEVHPDATINPITGAVNQPAQDSDEMTEEEKEAEAEKLFVLFDRLERTGAIPPSANPVRQAMRKAADS
ncbi:hypothetical protein PENSPDRAFT_620141 [Peniophora sp. CONT]|nr:hypothetical protein PENSPDRAFT_620141 [Peniophora sp. CONT]